jgi:hypothetical protein
LSTLGKLLGILNEDQKQEFVHAAGFQNLLEINLNKDIPPSFLQFLYYKIDPQTMILKVGPRKEIKFTKEVVRHMIDLPSSGEPQSNDMDWARRAREAKELRAALGVQNAVDLNVTRCMQCVRGGGTDDLTKRCFFLVLFNRFLFPSGSWHMCNSDI